MFFEAIIVAALILFAGIFIFAFKWPILGGLFLLMAIIYALTALCGVLLA